MRNGGYDSRGSSIGHSHTSNADVKTAGLSHVQADAGQGRAGCDNRVEHLDGRRSSVVLTATLRYLCHSCNAVAQ